MLCSSFSPVPTKGPVQALLDVASSCLISSSKPSASRAGRCRRGSGEQWSSALFAAVSESSPDYAKAFLLRSLQDTPGHPNSSEAGLVSRTAVVSVGFPEILL